MDLVKCNQINIRVKITLTGWYIDIFRVIFLKHNDKKKKIKQFKYYKKTKSIIILLL